MAKFTIDGRPIEAPDGAPLVEVLKQNGIYVSNLCYIDGLPPYAGCRTCLVEIEGARGLQLACTTSVRDDMEVRSNTAEVKQARQYVLSVINANHSDRCLTCHRRVKCMPGDICLRDDVVTHRCVTCSKNYRCELQTTNDLLDMGKDNVEPWESEDRTYYQADQPEPDRANPWLEFDPQMCIICTRCVRACDDLRHTGAITLAGRGFSTRIAFGSGGAIDESNCDYCGSCIDVCPTATLMEKPNKWLARTEDWVSTVCNSCSVGCTISIGHRNGKPVIVKPDTLNPFSDDQICVRGRFHYDAVKQKERLDQHLIRRQDAIPSRRPPGRRRSITPPIGSPRCESSTARAPSPSWARRSPPTRRTTWCSGWPARWWARPTSTSARGPCTGPPPAPPRPPSATRRCPPISWTSRRKRRRSW
ncbi:MAG: (2Fe-2S)-binding protein [Chloroflexi bacterium]|nr:(2Fe-2S)-binding protein [Chloroflexota bacterium]